MPFNVRALLCGLTALAVALPFGLPWQATPAQALPAGLPTHFGFGLSASPGDTWMPNSGIQWDYRYQYLSGGVNTGSGWETWNASGQFASYYASDSNNHGYIPVFPYYELLQSNGSCGSCGENQKDITNLNTPALMSAYYQNVALLMKRLGTGNYDGIAGVGKTTVIDLEPDFTGGYAMQAVNNNGVCFGFCTGQGNDPSLLKAAVSSSGFAEVAAYPNTYAGFTQAIAHLRDVYAPNVLLAYHVSPWATGTDIGTDTSSSVDAFGLGQQVGSFINKFGPHDLLFSDPLDRDAGQYKALYSQNRWWDRNNVTFPNFTRWEQYLHAAVQVDSNRPMLLWQVPLGNQYFDTENNTTGHYQDNRAEYIFGHVQELINAGVVGVMFGAGNGGNTTNTDAARDGITNPASFCTTDGISSGSACNNHTSTVSDDDGGYVRLQGGTYYTNPVSLSGGQPATPTATPPATSTATSVPTNTPTAIPTTPATSTATSVPTNTATSIPTNTPTSIPTTSATSTPVPAARGYTTGGRVSPTVVNRGSGVVLRVAVKSNTASSNLVDLEVYSPSSTKVFQKAWDNQSFSAGQSRTFSTSWTVPANAATGTYTVRVGVFSVGWGVLYSWNNNVATFTVK